MRRPRAQQLDKHKRNSRCFAATLCVCLVVLTWVVFGRTLRHEFVNYDDQEYVYQNKRITSGLSLENFCWATSQRNSALADEFQRNIAVYESGTPLRDSSLTDGHSSP
jgi:hypothetical protein